MNLFVPALNCILLVSCNLKLPPKWTQSSRLSALSVITFLKFKCMSSWYKSFFFLSKLPTLKIFDSFTTNGYQIKNVKV